MADVPIFKDSIIKSTSALVAALNEAAYSVKDVYISLLLQQASIELVRLNNEITTGKVQPPDVAQPIKHLPEIPVTDEQGDGIPILECERKTVFSDRSSFGVKRKMLTVSIYCYCFVVLLIAAFIIYVNTPHKKGESMTTVNTLIVLFKYSTYDVVYLLRVFKLNGQCFDIRLQDGQAQDMIAAGFETIEETPERNERCQQ